MRGKSRKLTADLLKRIFICLSRALDFLHSEADIVHSGTLPDSQGSIVFDSLLADAADIKANRYYVISGRLGSESLTTEIFNPASTKLRRCYLT
jgi:hypothetical protein